MYTLNETCQEWSTVNRSFIETSNGQFYETKHVHYCPTHNSVEIIPAKSCFTELMKELMIPIKHLDDSAYQSNGARDCISSLLDLEAN